VGRPENPNSARNASRLRRKSLARDRSASTSGAFGRYASDSARAAADEIARDVEALTASQDHLLSLAESQAENFPAMRYAAENLNPLSQQILQNLTQMLLSESEEPAPPRRQDREALLNLLPRRAFPWLSALMGLGLATTGALGIILAIQRTRGRRRRWAASCLFGGCILPVVLLAA